MVDMKKIKEKIKECWASMVITAVIMTIVVSLIWYLSTRDKETMTSGAQLARVQPNNRAAFYASRTDGYGEPSEDYYRSVENFRVKDAWKSGRESLGCGSKKEPFRVNDAWKAGRESLGHTSNEGFDIQDPYSAGRDAERFLSRRVGPAFNLAPIRVRNRESRVDGAIKALSKINQERTRRGGELMSWDEFWPTYKASHPLDDDAAVEGFTDKELKPY